MPDNDIRKLAQRMVAVDKDLRPYRKEILLRLKRFAETRQRIAPGMPLSDFANGYMYYGFSRDAHGWTFREWLPGADNVYLMGDFNGWDKHSHPLTRHGGDWEIRLKPDALREGQYIALNVVKDGCEMQRIPAYIRLCGADPATGHLCGRVTDPSRPFPWTDAGFTELKRSSTPLIYEAHIGMAEEKQGIGTYDEFIENVLPRVHRLGYDTLQLMAIQEHPYYASFGYQVSSLFATTFRYGDPDGLKRLINAAHGMGIAVLLDIVHSHACANEGEGLWRQDGTPDQYFLDLPRGFHSAWKTYLYNYSKTEVLHFLLSNCKYWLDEFHFDGFRFDGVTSMLYEDHGLGTSFVDYSQYYGLNANIDAEVYLSLANELIHAVRPSAIVIAEEMSGKPGVCLPLSQGGLGFDYRLAMGIPDYWIKLLKENGLGDWDMGRLWFELTTKRPKEKSISYAESHDQALVGDKTLIFRMMDAEMYTGMSVFQHSPTVDNAIDMHKLIRFLTLATASDGYLNFMGNEFGHPEWIDFPRSGNNWSYAYARRQWSLADKTHLRYHALEAFDRGMIHFAKRKRLLTRSAPESLWIDCENKLIAFARKGLIFAFNFHTDRSETAFFLPTHLTGSGAYKVVFSSDEKDFSGQARVDRKTVYRSMGTPRGEGFTIYLPARCALVLEKVTF